jgi:adenosylhomocysteine nucleosidase
MTVIETDKPWVQHACEQLAQLLPVTGAIAESAIVVSSSGDKLKLGNEKQAIALDMESAAIGRVAKARGLPFLAIRAIADPQSMNIPKAAGYAVDDEGQINLGKLMRYLVMHPYELPGLIRLGSHFKAAKNTLKQVSIAIDKHVGFMPKTSYLNN